MMHLYKTKHNNVKHEIITNQPIDIKAECIYNEISSPICGLIDKEISGYKLSFSQPIIVEPLGDFTFIDNIGNRLTVFSTKKINNSTLFCNNTSKGVMRYESELKEAS